MARYRHTHTEIRNILAGTFVPIFHFPDSILHLQVNDESFLFPYDIGNFTDCSILYKMAPNDALQGDCRARVEEFVWWEVL